jgi:NADH:ubiquinone oxidoreductase subunit 5 (subunit L)/multisubunit Na+/H+ antiporter MnhA subunit
MSGCLTQRRTHTVLSLNHAATMFSAGVYLSARFSP